MARSNMRRSGATMLAVLFLRLLRNCALTTLLLLVQFSLGVLTVLSGFSL